MDGNPGRDADAVLMERAKAGDNAAFETLVEKYRNTISKFLFRMVRDQAVSEELTQDVFLRLFSARARYQASAQFSTFAYLIARRVALNWLRGNRRERSHERLDAVEPDRRGLQVRDPRCDVHDRLVRQMRREYVTTAVQQLPRRQQEVLLLHKFEGLDCIQIAAMQGCSHQAVRSMLFRAYSQLRVLLAEVA